MYIWEFMTKALIFKPKKLKEGWEHKNGFYVSIDAKSALVAIDKGRSERKISKITKPNFYEKIDKEILRPRAETQLYEIQSSSNNYIEIITAFGGFGILAFLVELVPVIWSRPERDSVRVFLILIATLGLFIFLYFRKKQMDKNNIEAFLDIEDALYKQEYDESQYKN